MCHAATGELEKLKTGLAGFDSISFGGIPKNRTCLVSGTAGSGKTIFAVQFLVEGIRRGENGVFVTFEETPADIARNMDGFNWNLNQFVAENKLAFVDASPELHSENIESGTYDLGALIARIEYAIKKTQAQRLSVDALGAIFSRFAGGNIVRHELHRLMAAVKQMGVTALLTTERDVEYGGLARQGVEEFVADNVIILRNLLCKEKRRRTVEILKFRGADHSKGEYPFTIVTEDGIVVIPISAIRLQQKSTFNRVTSGNAKLDEMCGGGYFRGSTILVSGASGCGKTLLVTTFLYEGNQAKEKCLLFAFEESRDQLFRNASAWGIDFERMEHDGYLKVISDYPEVMGLEDHLIRMKKEILTYKPSRIAVDSLSALERIATVKGLSEFSIEIISFLKHQGIVSMFTAATSSLFNVNVITGDNLSTISDTIILTHYVEILGEIHRGIMVFKMRGSAHDKLIRSFTIDNEGLHIGPKFRNIAGILGGHPTQVHQHEVDRMKQLINDDTAL